MLISQDFNSETGDLANFLEHYKRAETMDNISAAKFLPQTRTVTPRDTKSVPSSRNVRKTVRNVVRKTPHFIALPMVKIKVTPLRSVTFSIKRLKIKTIQNMGKMITRRCSKNLTSWREKLPTKGPSIQSIKS